MTHEYIHGCAATFNAEVFDAGILRVSVLVTVEEAEADYEEGFDG